MICTVHYVQNTVVLYTLYETGDENGLQPVHEAVCHNKLDCLKYLMRKGTKKNAMDNHRRTPLHMVYMYLMLVYIYYSIHTHAHVLKMNVCTCLFRLHTMEHLTAYTGS